MTQTHREQMLLRVPKEKLVELIILLVTKFPEVVYNPAVDAWSKENILPLLDENHDRN